jgi:RNA polymerase sigma-70 factor (ECF subfamily)
MGEVPQTTENPIAQQFVVSDEVLIRRLRAGESASGEELVRRYAQPLLAYLHRLCGSPLVAEDMLQQTWLSVLEHIDRFDERAATGGFKAWLYRIATNKVNDLWRSQARKRKADEGLRLARVDDVYPDASEPLQGSEDCRRLQDAIQRLPEAQRQVVCMRYYANMKFVDIAATLGCPLNTALGRMHKALLKLREALET